MAEARGLLAVAKLEIVAERRGSLAALLLSEENMCAPTVCPNQKLLCGAFFSLCALIT